MLKWLFRKRIARVQAVEAYLSHFDAGELAYLKNITLMGLMPRPLPGSGLPAHDTILLIAYIQAEWMAATGQIEANPMERARIRGAYNIRLAKDATRLRGANSSQSLGLISAHTLVQPDLSADEEERLGAHAIVLERIFANPRNAATLPELNDINEGVDWLPVV